MKHFFKIFLLSSLSWPIFCMEKKITIEFPHKQGEIGLQQRASFFVPGVNDPKAVNFLVVNENNDELELCSNTKKKNHTILFKILNKEYNNKLARIEAGITFYCKGKCKGINSDVCKTKRPSKVKIAAKIFGEENTRYSDFFLVKGNRRNEMKNNIYARNQNSKRNRGSEHGEEERQEKENIQTENEYIQTNINATVKPQIICIPGFFQPTETVFNNNFIPQNNTFFGPKNSYIQVNDSYETSQYQQVLHNNSQESNIYPRPYREQSFFPTQPNNPIPVDDHWRRCLESIHSNKNAPTIPQVYRLQNHQPPPKNDPDSFNAKRNSDVILIIDSEDEVGDKKTSDMCAELQHENTNIEEIDEEVTENKYKSQATPNKMNLNNLLDDSSPYKAIDHSRHPMDLKYFLNDN